MFITVYEYVNETQPQVIDCLKESGLLDYNFRAKEKTESLTFGEIVELMRHDKWKRVRGAIRQIYPGREI